MALAPNENSQVRSADSDAQSPQQSDIRELDNGNLEATKAFEEIGTWRRHDLMGPPSRALDSAIDEYSKLTSMDSAVSHALRIGDLPQAVAALLHENLQLRREVESSRADFEELRSVNLAIQEQADGALRVADDQRLELIDELERTRGELLELESEIDAALKRWRERPKNSVQAG